MSSFSPWPFFDTEERAAVDAVMRSGRVNYWTGTESRQFEQEYARHLGVEHVIALANGTVALELPLRMWGIGPGDEVIVTPRSFIASVECVILQGATPVFADVDADSGNLTAATIEPHLTSKTRAIVPVHLAGWPCEMDAINELARARGIRVLEDCAQAHGALLDDRPVGSLADAAAFSFCQDKIMTTLGEGGLFATRDRDLWERAWSFKDHGKTWDSMYVREHAPPPAFRWVHDRFGTNWRITEAQGAVGRVQLRRLEDWINTRRRNAGILLERLAGLEVLRIPVPRAGIRHAYYKFYAYVREDRLAAGWTRDRILSEIAARGVPCFAGSCSEIYRERAFEGTPFAPAGRLPVARALGETSIMFLVHPTLTPDEMHAMADVITDVVGRAQARRHDR